MHTKISSNFNKCIHILSAIKKSNIDVKQILLKQLFVVSWRFVGSQQPAFRCGVLWGRTVCSSSQLPAGSLPIDSFPTASLSAVKLPASVPAVARPVERVPVPRVPVEPVVKVSYERPPTDTIRVVKVPVRAPVPNRPVVKEPTYTLRPVKPLNRIPTEKPRAIKIATPSISAGNKVVQKIPTENFPVVKFTYDQLPTEKLRPVNFYQFLTTPSAPVISTPVPSFHIKQPTINFSTPSVSTVRVPVVNKSTASPPTFKLSTASLSAVSRPASGGYTARIPAVSLPAKQPAGNFVGGNEPVSSQTKPRPISSSPTRYYEDDDDDGDKFSYLSHAKTPEYAVQHESLEGVSSS